MAVSHNRSNSSSLFGPNENRKIAVQGHGTYKQFGAGDHGHAVKSDSLTLRY